MEQKEKYLNVFKILNQYKLAYFRTLIHTKYAKNCNFFHFFWALPCGFMFRVFKIVTIALNALLSPLTTFNSALY
jgi:hypothetical protein